MNGQAALTSTAIAPADAAALKKAVKYLEGRNFAARLADYAGVPVNRVLGFLPKALNKQFSGFVRIAVMKGLEVAVDTLGDKPPRSPAMGFSSFLAGVTGGVSGLFGFGALAVELPLTTTLMLRAIAEIAQHQGEDLSTLEARLACLEVFAYGAKHTDENLDVGYYAARALISKYTHDVAAMALERGAIDASAPVVASLISEIVSRFGLVVSDKVAAGALPILGAVGGATVNIVFMDHFQQVAHAHFTLRRLERTYGSTYVKERYAELVAQKSNAVR
jgi:EcsC family protein